MGLLLLLVLLLLLLRSRRRARLLRRLLEERGPSDDRRMHGRPVQSTRRWVYLSRGAAACWINGMCVGAGSGRILAHVCVSRRVVGSDGSHHQISDEPP
jgi:hypothetical protein